MHATWLPRSSVRSFVVFPSVSVLYRRVRVCDVVYVTGTAGTGTVRVTGADESLLDVPGCEEEEEEEEEKPTQCAMTRRRRGGRFIQSKRSERC